MFGWFKRNSTSELFYFRGELQLNYERYLNVEYIIKEISQFIFDNESFLKTPSDNI